MLLRSLNYSYGAKIYKKIDADIRFAKEDWDALSMEAEQLGYDACGLLEKRLKETIRTGNPAARIAHFHDQRRFQEGYSDFWAPFVKYLITAHLSVIVGGFIVEQILGTGREYIFFYWLYLFSLILALAALLGFKVKKFFETRSHVSIPFEIKLASKSETLIWTSFIVFGLSFLARIILGLFHALSYFHLTELLPVCR